MTTVDKTITDKAKRGFMQIPSDKRARICAMCKSRAAGLSAAMMLVASSAAHAAPDANAMRKLELVPTAAAVVPLSATQLPEAPRADKQPLRIYIPNPKALRKLTPEEAALLDTNGGLPGAHAQIGNADAGDSATPSTILPARAAEPGRIEQALAAAASPFTNALAAVNSLFDNTHIVLTGFASQMQQETQALAQRVEEEAPKKTAMAEPAPAPKPVKPKPTHKTVAKAPASAPAREVATNQPVPAAAPAPVPATLQTTAQNGISLSPSPLLSVNTATSLPKTREEALKVHAFVPATDLADAMPAAPAQALAEGPVTSTGPIVYYNRASADLTAAQQAAEMSTLAPTAGVETVGPQGPIDTSPVTGAPEAPAPLIAPTTTQTVNAPGVASETPSPVAPAPSKSESAIAISDAKLPDDVKKTLNKTPSGLTTKPKIARGKKPVDIERSKDGDGKDAFTPDPTASKTMTVEDRMNVKIQERAPGLDLNYELELAYNELMSGHTEAAIARYTQVLANDKNNKNALFGLASIYHRLGQTDKARALYTQLLKLDPGNRDGLNNYLALASEASPQEALTELQSLQSRNPDFGPIPAQMAIIYQRLGQTDHALEQMIRAVSLAPDNITYVYNLAVLFDKAGKYRDAAGLYKQIITASYKGERPPADLAGIQQRLTFLNAKNP